MDEFSHPSYSSIASTSFRFLPNGNRNSEVTQPQVTSNVIVHKDDDGQTCISIDFESLKEPTISWYFQESKQKIESGDRHWLVTQHDFVGLYYVSSSLLTLLTNDAYNEGTYTVLAETEDGITDVTFRLQLRLDFTIHLVEESVHPSHCFTANGEKIERNGRAYSVPYSHIVDGDLWLKRVPDGDDIRMEILSSRGLMTSARLYKSILANLENYFRLSFPESYKEMVEMDRIMHPKWKQTRDIYMPVDLFESWPLLIFNLFHSAHSTGHVELWDKLDRRVMRDRRNDHYMTSHSDDSKDTTKRSVKWIQTHEEEEKRRIKFNRLPVEPKKVSSVAVKMSKKKERLDKIATVNRVKLWEDQHRTIPDHVGRELAPNFCPVEHLERYEGPMNAFVKRERDRLETFMDGQPKILYYGRTCEVRICLGGTPVRPKWTVKDLYKASDEPIEQSSGMRSIYNDAGKMTATEHALRLKNIDLQDFPFLVKFSGESINAYFEKELTIDLSSNPSLSFVDDPVVKVTYGTSDIQLYCRINAREQSKLRLYWTRDGQLLPAGFGERYCMQLDGTVVITVDIKEAVNKHTVYQCAIVYDDGFTSKPLVASWEIHFPLHEMSPFITQPPKLYTQRIREKGTSNIAVYMKVAFASGLETQVVWLDPRMKVIEKSELVNITVAKNGENSIAQLTLSQIRPAQSGKYICRLINGYGSMDVQFGIAPAPKFIDDFRGTHLHGDEPCTHYPGNEGKTEKVKDNKTEPLPLPEECFLIEMDRHRVKEMANNMMEFKRKRVAQQTSKLEAQQKKKNDRAEKGKRKTNVVPSDSDSDDDQTNNKTTSCA